MRLRWMVLQKCQCTCRLSALLAALVVHALLATVVAAAEEEGQAASAKSSLLPSTVSPSNIMHIALVLSRYKACTTFAATWRAAHNAMAAS